MGQTAGGGDLPAIDCAAGPAGRPQNDDPTGAGDSAVVSLDPLTLQDYKTGRGSLGWRQSPGKHLLQSSDEIRIHIWKISHHDRRGRATT